MGEQQMIVKVFSIFDAKSKLFGQPFFMGQNGQAIRAFTDLVNDENSMLNKHSGDFSLYQIASYDDNTAKFTNEEVISLLGIASEFIKEKKINIVEKEIIT